MFDHVDATAEPCLKYTVSCSEQLMPEAQHLHQTPEGVQFSAFSSERFISHRKTHTAFWITDQMHIKFSDII